LQRESSELGDVEAGKPDLEGIGTQALAVEKRARQKA
jgi:hypothetical protein